MSTEPEYYWYDGSTGGKGVTHVRDLRPRLAHPNNQVTAHDDGSITVDFAFGPPQTYYPATEEEAEAIRKDNAAYIEATRLLGEQVKSALTEAGLPMAQWMQLGGDGVLVTVTGSQVAVCWWHSTEKRRETHAGVWADVFKGRALRVLATLGGATVQGDYLIMTVPRDA